MYKPYAPEEFEELKIEVQDCLCDFGFQDEEEIKNRLIATVVSLKDESYKLAGWWAAECQSVTEENAKLRAIIEHGLGPEDLRNDH